MGDEICPQKYQKWHLEYQAIKKKTPKKRRKLGQYTTMKHEINVGQYHNIGNVTQNSSLSFSDLERLFLFFPQFSRFSLIYLKKLLRFF